MPRLAAVILLAGLSAAAVLPRRRPTTRAVKRSATPAEVQAAAERLILRFGEMPSRAVH